MAREHKWRAFEDMVEQYLRNTGMTVARQPVIGDARPDFVVTTDRGDRIVVEAKFWDESPANTARAIHQVHRYKELSKAAAALVVTPAGTYVPLSDGAVVPVSNLEAAISEIAANLARMPQTQQQVAPKASPGQSVFASMPFNGKYDDTFLVAIQPSALALNAVADRVDHTGGAGNVVEQIRAMIRKAKVVIADLSESRPNVCHEVGYAEALGRPVVQICSTPIADLPFNLRNNQTVTYEIGQTTKLRKKLDRELGRLLT